jgi:tRNA pseudouridine(38-40) synthase
MTQYLLAIAFYGRDFYGIIGHKDSLISQIKHVLRTKIKLLSNAKISCSVSSRTDAGVTALESYISLQLPFGIHLYNFMYKTLPKCKILYCGELESEKLLSIRPYIEYKIYKYYFSQIDCIRERAHGYYLRPDISIYKLKSLLNILSANTWWKNFCSEEWKEKYGLEDYRFIKKIQMKLCSNYIVIMGHSFLSHQIRRILFIVIGYAENRIALHAIANMLQKNTLYRLAIQPVPAEYLVLSKTKVKPSLFDNYRKINIR